MARTEAVGSHPTLACSALVKIYTTDTGETHALRGVDAEFDAGTVTALTGPSGSGKSSLLGLLALRDRPSGGEVTILGRRASTLTTRERRELGRSRISWVPQRPTDGLYPHLTAAQNVEQATRWRGASLGTGEALLERLGLHGAADVATARLSGGEQQRVAIACACVGDPQLILADEPTAELDEETAALVLAQLGVAAQEGSTVVIATHDARAVAVSHRVVALRHGVMSSEQWGSEVARATIDATGRIQLPPAALALFPDQRAEVHVDGGRVVLSPPPESA